MVSWVPRLLRGIETQFSFTDHDSAARATSCLEIEPALLIHSQTDRELQRFHGSALTLHFLSKSLGEVHAEAVPVHDDSSDTLDTCKCQPKTARVLADLTWIVGLRPFWWLVISIEDVNRNLEPGCLLADVIQFLDAYVDATFDPLYHVDLLGTEALALRKSAMRNIAQIWPLAREMNQ